MNPRYRFGEGARRAGLHPKHEGRIAALVLRAAGYPVTVDGVMNDAGVAFLRQYADVTVQAFMNAKHDSPAVLLDAVAARRAGRQLTRQGLAEPTTEQDLVRAA